MSRVQPRKNPARALFIAMLVLIVASALGWWVRTLRLQVAAEEAAQRARYEAINNKKDYQAATMACSLKFANGGVSRATPYEADFRWRGFPAELANSRDDVEGQDWAEFYAFADPASAQALFEQGFADTTHPLIRRRLQYLYFPSHGTEVERLDGTLQVYSEGEQYGWKVRVAWIPAPFGNASTAPAQPPDQVFRADIVDRLNAQGRSEGVSPWVWHGVDDFPDQGQRDAFRRAERQATEALRDRQREYESAKRHFENTHRNFFIVDAVNRVAPGQVLILRRFGQIYGPRTLDYASERIYAMIQSTQCGAEQGS